MGAITLVDARRKLAQVAEEAAGQVCITRPGAETLVLLSARELASITETAHLLSTDANRASLTRAVRDVEDGRTAEVRIDDL
jgi:prevent-host-death family protein